MASQDKSAFSTSVIIRNLCIIGYGQGFTLWHYKGQGASLDEISSPGYFDDATDMLQSGDMILVSTFSGGKILFVTRKATPVLTSSLQ